MSGMPRYSPTNDSSAALMNERVTGENDVNNPPSSIEPMTITFPPGRPSQMNVELELILRRIRTLTLDDDKGRRRFA